MYVYIYMCICVYVYVYTCIYFLNSSNSLYASKYSCPNVAYKKP